MAKRAGTARNNMPKTKKRKIATEAPQTSRTLRSNAASKAQLRVKEMEEMEARANEITEENRAKSPFLRLPGEIRNRIYEYAIGGNEVFPICSSAEAIIPGRRVRLHPTSYPRPGPASYLTSCSTSIKNHWITLQNISLVSRDISKETASLLYSSNIFMYTGKDNWSPWLNQLSAEKKAAIHTVQIHFLILSYGLPYDFRGRGNIWFLPYECTPEVFEHFPNLRRVIIMQRGGKLRIEKEVQEYAATRGWQVIMKRG